MAAGQLSLTRRALLAACAAVPVAADGGSLRHPGLDPGPMNTEGENSRWPCSWIADQVRNDRWHYALAHYRECDAALEAAGHTEDEDLYDRLGDRHDDALHSLLTTPAPDVAALALKLHLALDERTLEFFGDLRDMQALKRDARRLAAMP